MAKKVKGKLIARIKRSHSIESFRFIFQERIDFFPGQFARVIFNEEDLQDKELNKYLSFSSSPTKNYIELTKRLSGSRFSQSLDRLSPKDEVLFDFSLGSCVFKEEYKRIGFLIGGIGITPVISIIEYIMDRRLETNVVVFYSNRTEEDITFKKELDNWQAINKNISVVYFVTDYLPLNKQYILGMIDKDSVLRKVGADEERIFFIFGPPPMVEAMKMICLDIGYKGGNIKTEKFIGY